MQYTNSTSVKEVWEEHKLKKFDWTPILNTIHYSKYHLSSELELRPKYFIHRTDWQLLLSIFLM